MASLSDIPTPCFVLSAARLRANLETVNRLRESTGCKVLLATKAFALPAVFPLMRDDLDGTTASGEYEARLGAETFGKEVHVYSPAYAPGEVERLVEIAQHIYFNSATQLKQYGHIARARVRKSACASIQATRTRPWAVTCTIPVPRCPVSARLRADWVRSTGQM